MRFSRAILVLFIAVIAASCAANTNVSADSTTGSGSSSSAPSIAFDYYVDATNGSDGNAGSSNQPFKTITHAVQTAGTNQFIKVAPGYYTVTNGETFPIFLKSGQVLVGDISNKGAGSTPTRIIGSNAVFSTGYKSAVVLTNGNTFAGFQVDSPSGSLVSFMGIYLNGGTGIRVSNNTFGISCYGGIYLTRGSTVIIENNTLDPNSYGIFSDCSSNAVFRGNTFSSPSFSIRIDSGTSGLVISNNLITGNMMGVQNFYSDIAVISNVFSNSTGYGYGAITSYGSSLYVRMNKFMCKSNAIRMEYANTATLPNFGTIGDPGLNDFSTFTGAAIWLASTVTNTNFAIGNIWAHNPPTSADVIASSPCVVYWGTNTNTQKLP